MKVHNVKQGSSEWLALRAAPNTFTASEASAMMGASKYQTRTELLHQKHTGVTPDVDAVTQARFQAGHDTEALFLPIAEKIVDDELSPLTGTIELDGMILLASFDGLNFDHSDAYEHKLFNASVARDIELYGEPGPHYVWQMEHQLLVSGGKRVLFATSDGTEERSVTCFYESKPDRRSQLIAGWKQFAKDLAEFVPQEVLDKPVAKAVTALPAVMVQITGDLVVRDNFQVFETALRDFIDKRLIREPSSDQDFADLDLQIKALKNAEETLNAAEAQMLAQVSTVDTIKRTKDMLHKLTRDNRLMAEKLLAARKEEIKAEIVAEGVSKFRDHVAALNTRLGKSYMPTIPADFGGAVKGKRTVDSLREAVGNELTRAKIAANEVADRIDANLKHLREHASAHAFLFADTSTIVLKAADDLQMLVRSRIAEHEAAEQKKQDDLREQIRQEEAARLEREAAAKVAAEKAEADRVEREAYDRQVEKNAMAMQEIQGIQQQAFIAVTGRGKRRGGTIECIRETLAETEAWPITEENFGALTKSAQAIKDKVLAEIRERLTAAEAKAAAEVVEITEAQTPQQVLKAEAQAPEATARGVSVTASPSVGSMGAWQAADAAPDGGSRLTLGQINERIAPVSINVAGLASLGFVATTERAAKLYKESDFPWICSALIEHIEKVAVGVPA